MHESHGSSTSPVTRIAQRTLRLDWVDVAKAIGMFLVFLGHDLQQFMLSNTQAYSAFKLLYSFHMPLFFILAGFVSHDRPTTFKEYASRKFTTRILPMIFFNLLAVPFLLARDLEHNCVWLGLYVRGFLSFFRGYPSFNDVTWFFVCLFTTEIIHFFARDWLKSSARIATCMAGIYVAGWMITRHLDFVVSVTGIAGNFWYVHEALVAYAFYLLGRLLHWTGLFDKPAHLAREGILALICFGITVGTFGLNTSFESEKYRVVMMAGSAHGNFFWFPLTACAGSLFVILVSRLLRAPAGVLFIGRNTFWLLGLAGMFHHLVNAPVGEWIRPWIAGHPATLFPLSVLFTFVSMLICVPLIFVFNRYLPFLRGHRQFDRPHDFKEPGSGGYSPPSG